MTRIRRILCASDFSKTSGKALISAIDLAKANRARLTIVHAHVPIVPLVPEQYLKPALGTESTPKRDDGLNVRSRSSLRKRESVAYARPR